MPSEPVVVGGIGVAIADETMASIPDADGSSSVLGRMPNSSRRPDASNLPESDRKLTAISVALMTYLAVCGGPFGIETAVGAAGPLPTIIAIIALAGFWELPQALMTAELSTVFPSNAGYIGWVAKGLGPFWGYVNAANSLLVNVTDLPLYPVLIADYAVQIFDTDDGGILEWSIKGGALAVVVFLNILGVEVVVSSSVLFTLLIVAPFIVQMFLIEWKPQNWTYVAPEIDWVSFVSATLWSVQGFDSLGCIAGEVKNAGRTYPLGISIATMLITVNYLIPVMVGASVLQDFDEWKADDDDITAQGSSPGINFATVGKTIAPWMGLWVLVSAGIANLAEFSAIMTTSSRALQHVAEYGMLPSFVGCTLAKRNTPVVAILLQAVIVLVLMNFNFAQLVALDTMFNNVSLLLEVATFLYLKHTYPDMPRPYAVPYGVWGAWAVSIPKILVILGAFVLLGTSDYGITLLLIGVGVNLLFMALAYIWVHYTESGRSWTPDRGDDVESVGDTKHSAAIETTSLLGVGAASKQDTGAKSLSGMSLGFDDDEDGASYGSGYMTPTAALGSDADDEPADVARGTGASKKAAFAHHRRRGVAGDRMGLGGDGNKRGAGQVATTEDDGISLAEWQAEGGAASSGSLVDL